MEYWDTWRKKLVIISLRDVTVQTDDVTIVNITERSTITYSLVYWNMLLA